VALVVVELKLIIVHVFAGNELIEEDIDIGGNDLPPLAYPPVVFESETADRSSKHSSSSTSSSESGSSSSGMYFSLIYHLPSHITFPNFVSLPT
jgi:hypothetical protein